MPEDVFERFAEEYDQWFDEHRKEYQVELARIQRVLPSIDSHAIEVGVGSGRFAAPLGITLGIEPSRALGRMARRRGIEVIRGWAETLPIRDMSCSCILLVTVICFLDDPVTSFRELYRILTALGTVVIGFIEREGQIVQKYLHEGGKGRFLSHARFYSVDEVQMLLKGTKFHVIRDESEDGFCVISAQKN